MNKLHDINNMLRAVLESDEGAIDEETGLVLNTELLDKLDMKRTEKLEGLALYIDELEAFRRDLEDVIDRYKKRVEAIKNKAQRLKDWLIYNMEEFGDKKFETVKIRAAIRDNQRVELLDEETLEGLPTEYIKTEIKYSAKKAEILAALKKGERIPGARLGIRKTINFK